MTKRVSRGKAKSVFVFEDYKEFLRSRIDAGPTGFLSRLAEGAGCQRSYLSDVLRRSIQLTPDHAYGIAAFLALSEPEAAYFLDLVHFARAASSAYRAKLAKGLKAARQDHLRLSKRLSSEALPAERGGAKYYSSWHYGALHVATSIPRLRSVQAMAARFQLAEEQAAAILQALEVEGHVRRRGESYSYNEEHANLHLADDSPFSRMNHGNWRNLSQNRFTREGDVRYSVVFATEHKTYATLRAQLLDFIEQQRLEVGRSGSEEVACFTCDLYIP